MGFKSCLHFKNICFRVSIRLGNIEENEEITRSINHSIQHPEYIEEQGYFDIAVVTIAFVEYSKTVTPICVPIKADSRGTKYYNKPVTVAGRVSNSVSISSLKSNELVVQTAR